MIKIRVKCVALSRIVYGDNDWHYAKSILLLAKAYHEHGGECDFGVTQMCDRTPYRKKILLDEYTKDIFGILLPSVQGAFSSPMKYS